MGRMYLSWQLEALAAALAGDIAAHRAGADPLRPVRIVIPNRNVRKWLVLYLARRDGVCANIEYLFLEEALWKLVEELDDRPDKPAALDGDMLRAMILTVLLDGRKGDAKLTPIRDYLQADDGASFGRRAWQLSEILARSFRDYEYHRPEMIAAWREGQTLLGEIPAAREMELTQQALWEEIFGKGGLRDRLAEQKRHLTLGEYAREVLAEVNLFSKPRDEPVHFFGLSQISEFHARVLAELGQKLDVRIYYPTPLAAALESSADPRSALLERLRLRGKPEAADDPLEMWGRAGVRSLRNLVCVIESKHIFDLRVCAASALTGGKPAAGRRCHSVLQSLQQRILSAGDQVGRLTQDRSLQVMACFSPYREAETVYNNIIRNLREDPSLKLTDIAVLVTDMKRYRAPLQSVFTRRPAIVPFNLTDFSARGQRLWAGVAGDAGIGRRPILAERCLRAAGEPVFHGGRQDRPRDGRAVGELGARAEHLPLVRRRAQVGPGLSPDELLHVEAGDAAAADGAYLRSGGKRG